MIVKVRERWYDAADSDCFTLPCSDCAATINQSGINIVGAHAGVTLFCSLCSALRNRMLAAANLCRSQGGALSNEPKDEHDQKMSKRQVDARPQYAISA
jgi:hypothetical protein